MYMKGLTLTIIASLVLSSSVLGKDIKGRIIDENDKPLEFVNVVLLQDSTFVTGVITNGSGEFHLTSDLTTGLKLIQKLLKLLQMVCLGILRWSILIPS